MDARRDGAGVGLEDWDWGVQGGEGGKGGGRDGGDSGQGWKSKTA